MAVCGHAAREGRKHSVCGLVEAVLAQLMRRRARARNGPPSPGMQATGEELIEVADITAWNVNRRKLCQVMGAITKSVQYKALQEVMPPTGIDFIWLKRAPHSCTVFAASAS